jgi:hypothetical protein
MMPVVVEDHIPSVADAASAEASGNQVSDDVQLPRAARTPLEANPAEKRLHALTHLPHRDWCDVCITETALTNKRRTLLVFLKVLTAWRLSRWTTPSWRT